MAMKRKERYQNILNYFEANHPDAQTELEFKNPFQLLVAVILSAQCTDVRVNQTTPSLFNHYPDAKAMAAAKVEDVFKLIKSISYPNNKSKHLVAMSQMLLKDFNGSVPSDIKDLVMLPGVGRKTANVIASVVFNAPAMAVDTHVFRVSKRLGLTLGAKSPLQAELQLVKYIPANKIHIAHHWLILHGRYVCKARNPNCEDCKISQWCKYYGARTKTQ